MSAAIVTLPGYVKITRCRLSNYLIDADLEIFEQVQSIDIFEDISKPTMYAQISILDSVDLLHKFPIIGQEQIEITFQTAENVEVSYNFQVFEVSNINKIGSDRSQIYMLRCVSSEHLYNSSTLITQAYEGLLSDMVPDVLARYTKTRKPIAVDITKGAQTIIVPRLTPFEFIDMCRLKAVSQNYKASSFLFYENQDGFNFRTIESLIEEGVQNIGTKRFIYRRNQTVKDTNDKHALQFRTLQSYEYVQSVDNNERFVKGTLKAVTKTFDIATKKMNTIDFDLRNELEKMKFPNEKQKLDLTAEFISDYETNTPIQFFRFGNSLSPDNFIDTSLAIRNSYRNLFNSSFIRIKIHGDSSLKVGSVINVETPLSSGYDENSTDSESGNYLVLRLRHVLQGGVSPSHQMILDCTRVV
jgi:hypothetical protein